MSIETVVRLDLDGPDVEELVWQLTQSLLTRGIITENRHRDTLWQPSAWAPDPECRAVLERHPPDWRGLANNGVDISAKRQVHHPVENYEPPICALCSITFNEDAHHAAVESWLASLEPTLTCRACGWSALVGDWPAR